MIQKNNNGTYTVRVGHGGQRHTVSKWSEAQELEAQLKKANRRARAGLEDDEKGPITYKALIALWKTNYPPSEWRANMLAHSEKRWGEAWVRTIQPEAVGAWLHGLDLSAKTKTHILESMRQVMRAGVEWGYLRQSPVRPGAFKAPGQKRVTEIRPFESWAEVEAVAEALGKFGPFMRFACATGLRVPSEIMRVCPRDVLGDGLHLRVNGTKTENAERTIPLSELAQQALIRETPWPIKDDQPFWKFDYHEWRKTTWRDALAKVGLEYRPPYEMRHTFATLALQQGAPVEDVSKVMGHADITITLRYYRKWTRPMLDRLVSFLDQIGKDEESHVREG